MKGILLWPTYVLVVSAQAYHEHMTVYSNDTERVKEMARQTAGMAGAELTFR